MIATSETSISLPADAHGVRRLEFRAMGTRCLVLFREEDEKKALTFAADSLGWLGAFEAKFSRFRLDSLVARINAAAGREWVAVDAEMERMLDLAGSLHRITLGVLDPTMLPLLRLWDWKSVHEKLPAAAAIREAMELTGWNKLQRKKGSVLLPKAGMGLDFGGFGKEYAVDQIANLAADRGIRDVLVDFGRDVRASGGNGRHPFWHVGLEDGLRPGTCWGGIAASGFAVCTSGDAARYFLHQGRRYGHILDPRTGWPVANGVRSVTALAPTCLQAGIYSTAACILGAEEGLSLVRCAKDVEACVQTGTGVEATRGFIHRQVQAA